MNAQPQINSETISLNFPVEVAGNLREKARKSGSSLEGYLLQLAQRELPVTSTQQTAAEWVSELHAWAASHEKREIHMDDSRESIYEGCGE